MKVAFLAVLIVTISMIGVLNTDQGEASHAYPDSGGGLADYHSYYDLFQGRSGDGRSWEVTWSLCVGGGNDWNWNGFSWIDLVNTMAKWDSNVLHGGQAQYHWSLTNLDCSGFGHMDDDLAVYSLPSNKTECGSTTEHHGCMVTTPGVYDVHNNLYHDESGLSDRTQKRWGRIFWNYNLIRHHTFAEKQQITLHESGHSLSLDHHNAVPGDCGLDTVMRWVCSNPKTAPSIGDATSVKAYYHWWHFGP